MKDIKQYVLDLHCQMILDKYRENMPVFKKMKEVIESVLNKSLTDNHIIVTAVEARIKTENSLAGKLELKGSKYNTLSDLTDIVGARVITFYNDEVDKIAALMEKKFDIDWKNSVDKRKMYSLNTFGYLSLHYICRIPKKLYYHPEMPEINEYRFEIQMRTALQHVWANMHHDIGYKTDIEVPPEYLRNLSRLAGMLELADDEFSRIRTTINEYRYKVSNLLKDGKFEEINLDGDSFTKYMELEPFRKLTEKIAAINQAEILPTPIRPFLKVLIHLDFKTLADIEKLIADYSEAAYQLALHQFSGTDLDIVASNIGLQNLCIVYQIINGAGVMDLAKFFDVLNGESQGNITRAQTLLEETKSLSFMMKQ